MTPKARCEKCRYFLAQPGTSDGQCRIRAPIAQLIGVEEVKAPNGNVMGRKPLFGSAWPQVGKDRWCGEFEEEVTLQ